MGCLREQLRLRHVERPGAQLHRTMLPRGSESQRNSYGAGPREKAKVEPEESELSSPRACGQAEERQGAGFLIPLRYLCTAVARDKETAAQAVVGKGLEDTVKRKIFHHALWVVPMECYLEKQPLRK